MRLCCFQVQEERMFIIERDNHLLASKLAAISRSKGLVDHRNIYPECRCLCVYVTGSV